MHSKKAIVLCAGYGTRLGSLTRDVPKPLLPLQGKPMLSYTLRHLALHGFTQVAINLHYLGDRISDCFADGKDFGLSIHYSYEPKLLGTAGAVKNLEDWLHDIDDFLVIYGDVLTDQDLTCLFDTHREQKGMGTLLLHQRAGSNSVVEMDETGRIRTFVERPTDSERTELSGGWVNSGVHVLNSRIFKYIPYGATADFPRDVFSKIVDKEQFFGFPLTGYRCAVDSQARYAEADQAVAKGLYRLRGLAK